MRIKENHKLKGDMLEFGDWNNHQSEMMTWIVESKPSEVRVWLKGPLNEDFAYAELAEELQKCRHCFLRLNLKQVLRVNSTGIREWFNLMQTLSWPSLLILEDCSPAFTQALTQIEEMSLGCWVESCNLPVWCPSCEQEFELKIELTTPLLNQTIQIPCPDCSQQCRPDIEGIVQIVRQQASRHED